MNAKYYVLQKSLWRNDDWKAIKGFYTSLDDAEKVAAEYESDGYNDYGLQTLNNVRETYVANTTHMRKHFGIEKSQALETIAYFEQEEIYLSSSEDNR